MVFIHRTRQRDVEPSHTPLAREVSTQSESAGPSARLLRSDEHWRPRTWKHFEHAVLTTLRRRGARSVDELAEEPPEVLFVPMARDELAAALDSARRRGLVEPLGHSRRPDGQDAGDEWTLTKEGSRAVRTGLSWLVGNLGGLRTTVGNLSFLRTAVVPILGLGLTTDFISRQFAANSWTVVGIAVIFAAAMLWVRAEVTGVSAQGAVAKDWARWEKERPEWRRIALHPFPRLWAILGVVGVCVGMVGVALLGPFESGLGLYVPLAGVPAIPSLVKLSKWLRRWSTIADDAQKRRRNLASAAKTDEDASLTMDDALTPRHQPAAGATTLGLGSVPRLSRDADKSRERLAFSGAPA